MLLLKKGMLEVESDSPRVSAEDAAAVTRAVDIVAAAEAEAERIRVEAQKAYEEEKKRGYADGIAEGKAEILTQKLDLIDDSVAYMESIEAKVADIVLKAVRKCIAEMDDVELVQQIVRKSLQAVVRTQKEITIRVAPDRVADIKAKADSIRSEFPTVNFINVEADNRLVGAACVVETSSGIVEASVDGQIDAIERSIRRYLGERAEGLRG